MIADQVRERARAASYNARSETPTPKMGTEIFDGTDYPRTWDEFIGQERAVTQLRATCFSARRRQTRLDHVLLASGVHGIGKTSLAKLIAADIGTGLVEVSGTVGMDDIRPVLAQMCHNDVLFIDEIHALVSRGKVKAEWLLHLLQDGVLLSAKGAEPMPRVTVIGATTDAQKLPETILSRFPVRPVLEPYTVEQAALIAAQMAPKVGFDSILLTEPSLATLAAVARAGNCEPREIRKVLIALRDAAITRHAEVTAEGDYDLEAALAWAGTTADGLTRLAQDYLMVLVTTFEGKAGERTIAAALGEPGPLRHTEKLLTQKGLLTVTASGRELTVTGVERAVALLAETEQVDAS